MNNSKTKELVKKNLDSITDEEMISEFNARINIEFTMKNEKYIFKNVKESFLDDLSRVKLIKELTLEVEWYDYDAFDTIDILGEKFLITESTKSKVVLVQGNS
jgi:hypothetical protein